jgi:hypothetical protein
MAIVVEAETADQAWDAVTERIAPQRGEQVAYFVGDALLVADRDEYDSRTVAAAITDHRDLPS